MQNNLDNQFAEDANSEFDIAVLAVIGDRKNQQDAFDFSMKEDECFVVVCDGMGGHQGGQIASRTAVDKFLADYEEQYPCSDPVQQMIDSAKAIDKLITGLVNEEGVKMNAGTTGVVIFIRKEHLYWCSVGDSRAYLLRGKEFVKLTQDQNYGTVLGEQLRVGIIDEEQYQRELTRGETLISYMGIGDLSLIDYNDSPLKIRSGDRIVIMTDGLYKLVPEIEIKRVVKNIKNNSDVLQGLNSKAERASYEKSEPRDNMTVAVISIL